MAATHDTIPPGEYGGRNLAEAFYNPGHLDIVQVVNQSGKVVWSLNYQGTVSINPAHPSGQAILGKFEGATFALAFPNPYAKDVLQIIGPGDKVYFWVDYLGVAHTV